MSSTPPQAPPQTRPPFRDAPLTVLLLLCGLWNVTATVVSARKLPIVLDETYIAAGIGRYTSAALATNVGWAVCITQIVALAIAIGFSVVRIREHRRAFWIPLVVAVVCFVVTAILFMVAILGDPAFFVYASRLRT